VCSSDLTGWRNKLTTFASSPVSKPLAARVAGLVLGAYRRAQKKP
jgi:hypothetical protein